MALLIRFGKHKGNTVEYMFFKDPGYIYWMVGEGIHEDSSKFSSTEQEHFKNLLRRAEHLKIPGICSFCNENPITRMFLTAHTSGGLACVDFDCDECAPPGNRSVAVKPGFWTPDAFRNYDKTGADFLIKAIKYRLFGDRSYRMIASRLEEFWNNPENFVNF